VGLKSSFFKKNIFLKKKNLFSNDRKKKNVLFLSKRKMVNAIWLCYSYAKMVEEESYAKMVADEKGVMSDKDGRMCKQPAMVTDFICVSLVAVCYNCAHGSTDRHADVPDPPGCSL
jgi:hypothetical protein